MELPLFERAVLIIKKIETLINQSCKQNHTFIDYDDV